MCDEPVPRKSLPANDFYSDELFEFQHVEEGEESDSQMVASLEQKLRQAAAMEAHNVQLGSEQQESRQVVPGPDCNRNNSFMWDRVKTVGTLNYGEEKENRESREAHTARPRHREEGQARDTGSRPHQQTVSSYVSAVEVSVAQNADGKYVKRSICCNCKKSQCLKLYCECFANKTFCHGCNCVNCLNTEENATERDKAMKATLERNPTAFDPKIALSQQKEAIKSVPKDDEDPLSLHHTRGCHCKKSGCQKKYCECYQSGAFCSALCKCEQCKNLAEEITTLFAAKGAKGKRAAEIVEATPTRPGAERCFSSNRTPLTSTRRKKVDKSGEKVLAPRRTLGQSKQVGKRNVRQSVETAFAATVPSEKKERLGAGRSASKRAITNN